MSVDKVYFIKIPITVWLVSTFNPWKEVVDDKLKFTNTHHRQLFVLYKTHRRISEVPHSYLEVSTAVTAPQSCSSCYVCSASINNLSSHVNLIARSFTVTFFNWHWHWYIRISRHKAARPKVMNTFTQLPICHYANRRIYQCKYAATHTHTHAHTHWHTHNRLTALFPGLPGWAGARRNLLDFMVQGKITEADTPTIRLGATSSGLISDPPPSYPNFYAGCPSCRNSPPIIFILAWDRHQICWLACPVAWL